MISLFGWLDSIPLWRDLSYPVKGALLRALKAGLSSIIGILVAAATQGTLYPEAYSPVIIILITTGLQAADKYIREWKVAQDTTQNTTPPTV